VERLAFHRSGARSNDGNTPTVAKASIAAATPIMIRVPIIIFFIICLSPSLQCPIQ
jgi:hypothetical protein